MGRVSRRTSRRSRASSPGRPCASTRCRTPAPRRTSTRSQYLAKYGVKPDEILKDVLDFWAARATLRQAGNGGGHILTGPIYVEDAAPGDTLEVQILVADDAGAVRDEQHELERRRVPRRPTRCREGDAPFEVPEGSSVTSIERARPAASDVAFFADGIQVPLNPMMGIMAVVPEGSGDGRRRRARAGLAGLGAAGAVRRQHGFPDADDRHAACICRSSIPARSSTPAIRTARRVTAKSAATRSSSR